MKPTTTFKSLVYTPLTKITRQSKKEVLYYLGLELRLMRQINRRYTNEYFMWVTLHIFFKLPKYTKFPASKIHSM